MGIWRFNSEIETLTEEIYSENWGETILQGQTRKSQELGELTGPLGFSDGLPLAGSCLKPGGLGDVIVLSLKESAEGTVGFVELLLTGGLVHLQVEPAVGVAVTLEATHRTSHVDEVLGEGYQTLGAVSSQYLGEGSSEASNVVRLLVDDSGAVKPLLANLDLAGLAKLSADCVEINLALLKGQTRRIQLLCGNHQLVVDILEKGVGGILGRFILDLIKAFDGSLVELILVHGEVKSGRVGGINYNLRGGGVKFIRSPGILKFWLASVKLVKPTAKTKKRLYQKQNHYIFNF